jgi:hypothetical protein
MNVEQLKAFVCLETRKRELDSELKAIAARIDDLEQALIPQFLSHNLSSIKLNGLIIYIAEDIQAAPVNDRAEVIGALKQSDLGQYISENYNTQSLRAYVREVAAETRLCCQQQNRLFTEEDVRAALPPQLCGALKISFVHSLRSRKA